MTTNNWNLDTVHSGINFSVRHMVVSKVRGRFTKFTGNIALDENDLARSTVEATIEERIEVRHVLRVNFEETVRIAFAPAIERCTLQCHDLSRNGCSVVCIAH